MMTIDDSVDVTEVNLDPDDINIRLQALGFAVDLMAKSSNSMSIKQFMALAATIEEYIRNGKKEMTDE